MKVVVVASLDQDTWTSAKVVKGDQRIQRIQRIQRCIDHPSGEIWTRPEGIGTTDNLAGYTCLRYVSNQH